MQKCFKSPRKQSDHCLLVTQISKVFLGLEMPVRLVGHPYHLSLSSPQDVLAPFGAGQSPLPQDEGNGPRSSSVTVKL